MKYNEHLKIKKNLIRKTNKIFPLSCNINTIDSFWSIHKDNTLKKENDKQEIGIYIGKSIEQLSLSDITLLIHKKIDKQMEHDYE